jgi:hypothetical protein
VPFTDVGGTRVRYRVDGAGEPLVLTAGTEFGLVEAPLANRDDKTALEL